MKKIISILLALLMCLSLCACGGKDEPIQQESSSNGTEDTTNVPEYSEEELVASTPFLNLDEMWNTIDTNQAKAKLTYDQKMFQVNVTVLNISTNYFDYMFKYNDGVMKSFKVFMPTETLATLTNNSHITVLGKLVISGSSAYLEDAFVVDSSNVEQKSFDDETIQKAIDDYNLNNSGKIDWNKGSGPFFIDNRLYFEELTADTFLKEMEGEWFGKEYSNARTTRQIVFTSDSTADVSTNGGKVYEWKYSFVGNLLKFPEAASEPYEVRKVSDRLIVFYADTMGYVPYWILYKE